MLILMPGFQGGAGDFTLDARELGLQVWALDRRTQPLEDTSRFDALAGRITIKQAFDYYLGWLSDPSIQPHFQPLDTAQFGFAKQWGLSLTLRDVRRVVLKAIKALDTNGPFVDLLGLKLPWAAGVFSEMAAVAALKEPTAPSLAQSFPLLPAVFKPPIPATNRGQLGFAFDASTSPKSLSLIHVQAGMLGANGDWVDGEVTPIERLAQTFAQEPNAAEWYFPAKLTIDVEAANALTRSKQTDYLKLRPWHRRAVDLPLYALQTESHLDPLTAAPDRNRLLQTVVPFLRAVR